MADIVQQRDIGSLTQQVVASAYTSVTAGGTGDATAVTGLTIDRQALGLPKSAVFGLAYEAVLGQGNTIAFTSVKVEHSADGSTWSTYTPASGALTAPGVVDTGGTGGSTQRGLVKVPVGLGGAQRYVRFDFTPDLSAASTDTAKIIAVALLAGTSHLPAP